MGMDLHEVGEAFAAYERALMADDVDALDGWFLDAAHTLRADAQGVLVGSDAIAAFRRSRPGGAPARIVDRLHLTEAVPGTVVAVAELRRADGGRGLQTQVWVDTPDGPRIASAHVSSAAADPVWRLRGTPLVAGHPDGPLTGVGVAVKDLYALAGYRIGAGNPTWLAQAPVQRDSAPAVRALCGAGAHVVGIAHTDEFAYSLSGTNVHYGTPPNPGAPGRVPGGSSGGPAAAVALGEVVLGLGTDTAGSVRVPASYLGLFGLRTTHGAVSTEGLLALAPAFDTVGWLTRDAGALTAAGDVLLPPMPAQPVTRGLLATDLFALADAEVADTCRQAVGRLRLGTVEEVDVCGGKLEEWFAAFRAVQGRAAHLGHGAWVAAHPDALGPGISERFALAARVTDDEHARALDVLGAARQRLRALVPPGTTILLPATSTVAPPLDQDAGAKAVMRAGTLRLTCLASLAGLPAVALPTRAGGLPVGLCAIGAVGADRDLLALATRYAG